MNEFGTTFDLKEVQRQLAETWRDVDFIGILGNPSVPTRAKKLQITLQRMSGKPVYISWNPPTPFTNYVGRSCDRKTALGRKYSLCTMGHSRLISIGVGLGAQRLAIFEDDLHFLLDSEMLIRTLASRPRDADIALLDWTYWQVGRMPEICHYIDEMHSQWHDNLWVPGVIFHGLGLMSCGAYILSKYAAEQILHLHQDVVDGQYWPPWRIFYTDHVWHCVVARSENLDPPLRTYCARLRPCIQYWHPGAGSGHLVPRVYSSDPRCPPIDLYGDLCEHWLKDASYDSTQS